MRNILKAALGLDAAEVDSIRPDLQADETDLNAPDEGVFSNWELVKKECRELTRIVQYLGSELAEARLVVVQIDAAECELPNFGVVRLDRGRDDYVSACHEAVVDAIRAWILEGPNASMQSWVVEAVAVEETDAWLLPLYDTERRRDSGTLPNPKERLARCLQVTNRFTQQQRLSILREPETLRRYDALSAPLRKGKELRDVMTRNASLRRFVDALQAASARIEPV